ncbi:MAG: AhpC/TSA family protein [Prevotellaceae bacterium]|jgi:thiol-disulfide isomerase/thioredoxin|nr:AhpC/TSA family protein [Prevotellaceae bacterium]
MKKTACVITTLLTTACVPLDGYVIKGTIDGLTDGMAVLRNASREFPVADTAVIENGRFEFSGKVTTPEPYYLSIEGDKPAGQLSFFLDNGKITIRASIDSLSRTMILTGPATTLFAKSVDDVERRFYDAWPYDFESLLREYCDAATSPERKTEILQIAEEAEERVAGMQKIMTMEYAETHPASAYTAYILKRHTEYFPVEEMEIYLSALQDAQPANRIVQELAAALPALKATAEGQPAPDFTQHDPAGKPLAFSDVYMKNKLTMINFWASWNGSCRRFNPTLVALYNKYHPKGLEIVAVSLDSRQDSWTEAIAKDGLKWYHMSDLNGWNNAVARQYNIRYIPQNVFVNASGEIVGKRIPESDMDAFLASQLN